MKFENLNYDQDRITSWLHRESQLPVMPEAHTSTGDNSSENRFESDVLHQYNIKEDIQTKIFQIDISH